MTIIRVGVQAVSTSAGQVVDFDFGSVTITSLVNLSGVVVQYSTNSGGSWSSIAAGATAGVGLVVQASAFRLRLAVNGAYPAPVDVDFQPVETTSGVPVQSIAAIGADDFRGSKLRGLATDTVLSGAPRSADYIALFSRFRANITRRFVIPTQPALGEDYVIDEGVYSALITDLGQFAAVGARTVLAMSPARTGVGDQSRLTEFWNSPTSQAKYVQAWAQMATRLAGDKRVAGFDLINEPFNATPGFDTTQAGTDQILALQEACIAAVRAADPTRVCIVTCGWAGAPGGFRNMRPVPFPNVVYTFHFYQPFEITHAQVLGTATYSGTYPSTQVLAGETGVGVDLFGATLATKSRMVADLQAPIAFSKRYGVPMFVGEFACTRYNQGGVAPRWTEDAIDIINSYGWSWAHFGFWFPPLPWASLILDTDTVADMAFDNGVTSGNTKMSIVTGGSTTARAPIAVVSAALEDVALYEGATPLPTAGVYVEETFEATLGRLGGAGSSSVQDAGMSLVLNSTAAPKTGTRHMRATHSSTPGGSDQRAGCFLQNIGAGKDFNEFWFSFDVRLGSAITASNTFTLVECSTFGDGSAAYLQLRNNPGTNTWVLDNWRGTGDFGTRPIFQITGMALTVGAYVNIKMAWQNSTTDGRMRVWQDRKLLVDINRFGTTATTADRLWNVFYGLLRSTQVGQVLDFDNVKYSAGADLT
jgi:hypothetical protein